MSEVAWCATVMPDWTTLQLASGEAFAFNRETGRVYRLPHPECPFVFVGAPPAFDPDENVGGDATIAASREVG